MQYAYLSKIGVRHDEAKRPLIDVAEILTAVGLVTRLTEFEIVKPGTVLSDLSGCQFLSPRRQELAGRETGHS